MRLLITGASGYLGSHLVTRTLETHPKWNLYATFFSHSPELQVPASFLDLRDAYSVSQLLGAVKPDLVVHTAALMGCDGLEPNDAQGEAWATNVYGASHLARAAERIGARIIHVSTDVVFDGEHAPYDEDAPPHPINRYGASKAEAERAVISSGADSVIVRTSLTYGFNPLDPRTRALLEGRMNCLFVDEFRSPIWVSDLADALLELCENDYRGVLNIAGAQRLNRYEFGLKCVHALGANGSSLTPIQRSTSPYVRPRDCTLDIVRARRVLKTKLQSVDEVTAMRKGQ